MPDGGVHAARVEEDFRGGLASGVDGTPGIFFDGARDHAALLAALQRAPATP